MVYGDLIFAEYRVELILTRRDQVRSRSQLPAVCISMSLRFTEQQSIIRRLSIQRTISIYFERIQPCERTVT